MRISDWSSDVCSSDLSMFTSSMRLGIIALVPAVGFRQGKCNSRARRSARDSKDLVGIAGAASAESAGCPAAAGLLRVIKYRLRSEEHTSELQSLMRNSYAVFCLNKKTHQINKYQQPVS